VVIPTYNRCDLLAHTLESFTRQTLPVDEYEVIVADDGSHDATRELVDSYADRLRVKYHYQEDLGYRVAAARNGGVALAEAPVLVFADSGQVAGPDLLARHLRTHERHPDGCAVMGYLYGYNPALPDPEGLSEALGTLSAEEVVARFRDDPKFPDVRHQAFVRCDFDPGRRAVPWMVFFTGNCSMRTEDFRAVGGFNEVFRGWGAEDLELAYKLHRNGIPLRIEPDAWVIEAPHERDWPAQFASLGVNMGVFHDVHTDPVVEVGWAVVTGGDFMPWEDEYHRLVTWRESVHGVDAATEIEAALRTVPPDTTVAILGCGGKLPPDLPPSVLFDFDRDLLDRALADGRHTGHHALGLRTPLADRSVHTVIVTSRLAGLWQRWSDRVLAEAHRIGERVLTYYDSY
jgi:GT2 family glycosyltransferase